MNLLTAGRHPDRAVRLRRRIRGLNRGYYGYGGVRRNRACAADHRPGAAIRRRAHLVIQLLPGDCRDVLATLPADSVQCVVTSPPYYGLRDYGTAQWDGGMRRMLLRWHRSRFGEELPRQAGALRGGYGGTGLARDVGRRVDRQIGLEATARRVSATMVSVFGRCAVFCGGMGRAG